MSGQRYEHLPRSLVLTKTVRLVGERVVIGVHVYRGEVHISSEEVFLSVDDAALMNAQLTHLLNERAFPGLAERERQRARERWRL